MPFPHYTKFKPTKQLKKLLRYMFGPPPAYDRGGTLGFTGGVLVRVKKTILLEPRPISLLERQPICENRYLKTCGSHSQAARSFRLFAWNVHPKCKRWMFNAAFIIQRVVIGKILKHLVLPGGCWKLSPSRFKRTFFDC